MRSPESNEPLPLDPNDGRLLAAGAQPATYERIRTTGESTVEPVAVNRFQRGAKYVIFKIKKDTTGETVRDSSGFPQLDLTEGLLVQTVEDPGLGETPGTIHVKTKLIRTVSKEELEKI